MKKTGLLFAAILSIFLISGCGEAANDASIQEKSKHDVEIEMICNENVFFSRYDVVVFVNDVEIGTLEHGKTDTYTLELEEGENVLRVEKEEDNAVDGEISFSVSSDMRLKCELSCKSDQIQIVQTNEISPPMGTDELGEMKLEEVKKIFEDTGFTNIEERALKDLTEDKMDENNVVSKISIGETASFTKDDKFMADTKVVIEYHSEKEIEVSAGAEEYEGRNYREVLKAFEEMGFKNIDTETASSFWEEDDKEVYRVSINGGSFTEGDFFLPDSEVVISYYVVNEDESEDEKKSAAKLSEYYAKKAFEKYGESQYPFGFKCHWIMDLRNAEQEGNTWYFKVGVTITNAYGTKYDTVAEGMVTGSDSAPEIVQFYVSN